MLLPAIVLVLVTKGGAGRVTRGTPALQGEIATQLVITDTGATAICDLKVGIAGSQISKTSVNCFYPNDLGMNPYFGWKTESKTFYDKIGEEVYKIDLTTKIYIGENNHLSNIVKSLNLKLSPFCGTDSGVTNTTMTYPSSSSFSSGGSMGSSNPEGFVLAFVSSFDTPSSGGSVGSSVPEGFVFAFGDPSASSSPSVASSTPEGFVFAFTASSNTDK